MAAPDPGLRGTDIAARSNAGLKRSGIAGAAFGLFIAVTSLVGIAIGVQGGEGWLAILYGALGMSMGVAGVAGVWMKGLARTALLGWFLVGVASRAIVEGDAYLAFISLPIAAVLVGALIFELVKRPSLAGTLAAAAAGCLAIVSFAALAIVAPSLPAICPPNFPQAHQPLLLSYPPNTPPFNKAEETYYLRCTQ